jgi:histidyl-tRNA synthetase
MLTSRKPQILKGFRDYTSDQMLLRQEVIARFREVFERHGYEPIDTPALEYMEILTGKAGENEKLMYHFLDQGDREIGLRYDLTVPLARYVAMHQNDIVVPFKRYHIAPVWRAEKPQRGRFREFWQCDADIVGSPSMLADAESISVLVDALHSVNLRSAVVAINHRKLLEALGRLARVPDNQAPTIFRAVDKLAKVGPDGVRRELVGAGIGNEPASRVLELVTLEGTSDELLDEADRRLEGIPGGPESVRQLRELVDYIEQLGVPRNAWQIDLSLARGIDYYTGPVYEAIIEEPKVGSVAGAGRYDGLIGQFLGRDIPATGMSLGFERIIEVVREFDLLAIPASAADVFMVGFPDTLADTARIARQLRADAIKVDLSMLPHRHVGEQLRYASRRDIPLAIIIGGSEIERQVATVRDLRSGEQREVALSLLSEAIARTMTERRE